MRCLLPLLVVAACRPDEPTDSAAPTAADPCLTGEGYTFDLPEGLDAPVEVLVDDLGTPHVYAASDPDLLFASGYLQARDRLWQIDMSVRAADGRLAEILGPDALESDLQARVMGFWRAGCQSIPGLQEARPDDFALFLAWVAGVNRYVDEVVAGTAPLPEGFARHGYAPEHLRPEDVLAMGKRIQFGFANSLTHDILYSLIQGFLVAYDEMPVFQPGAPRFVMVDEPPPAARRPVAGVVPYRIDESGARRVVQALAALEANHGWGPGSNNWVLSGTKTTTGSTVLANDPHATIADPSLLYTQHLDSAAAGGSFSVAGWSFVGVPGVHLGHTATMAWAATTNMADVMDVWDVPVAEDWSVAWLGGDEVPATSEDEAIRVLQEDGTVEETVVTVHRLEGLGVFLPEEMLPAPQSLFADGGVLFGWTGFRLTLEFYQYFDLDRAADLDAFEAAVDLEEVGIHNWIGATAEAWRYRVHGSLPDRGPLGERGAPYAIMDGSDPDTLWNEGMLEQDWLPKLDGDLDFLVTANNDPWGHTADNDPLNDGVYYASYFAAGFRAERLHAGSRS